MTTMTVSVLVVVIINMSWIIVTVVMIRIVVVEMMAGLGFATAESFRGKVAQVQRHGVAHSTSLLGSKGYGVFVELFQHSRAVNDVWWKRCDLSGEVFHAGFLRCLHRRRFWNRAFFVVVFVAG